MTVEIKDDERDLLLETLQEGLKHYIHELDHTDRRDYKIIVKERLRILESLLAKLKPAS